MNQETQDKMTEDYMQDIRNQAIDGMNVIMNNIVKKDGPCFDDQEIAVSILEAVTQIVGYEGGDFSTHTHAEAISLLIGAAAQLAMRFTPVNEIIGSSAGNDA